MQFSPVFSISLARLRFESLYQVYDRTQIRVHIPGKCGPPDSWKASGAGSSLVSMMMMPFILFCVVVMTVHASGVDRTHLTRCHVDDSTQFRAHVPRKCGPLRQLECLRAWSSLFVSRKRMLIHFALCVHLDSTCIWRCSHALMRCFDQRKHLSLVFVEGHKRALDVYPERDFLEHPGQGSRFSGSADRPDS